MPAASCQPPAISEAGASVLPSSAASIISWRQARTSAEAPHRAIALHHRHRHHQHACHSRAHTTTPPHHPRAAGLQEHSALDPTNPYSAAKAGAEMMCKAYLTSYKLPVIVTRGNNVYGPHQFPEKMIPKFTLLASRGKELPVHGALGRCGCARLGCCAAPTRWPGLGKQPQACACARRQGGQGRVPARVLRLHRPACPHRRRPPPSPRRRRRQRAQLPVCGGRRRGV
jgi:hypothetical protein